METKGPLTPDGVKSVELLKKLGFPEVPKDKHFARPGVKFVSYPGMAHSSCIEEINDFGAWIAAALGDK